MRPHTSASQACGSMSFILAVTIRLYMAAARVCKCRETGSQLIGPIVAALVRPANMFD